MLLAITACGSLPPRAPSSHPSLPGRSGDKPITNAGRYSMDKDAHPDRTEVPYDVDQTPDAVPRKEPRSRSGNSPVYEVFGKTYRVLPDAEGFKERGGASWYGKKFQGHKTASGEIYDMFKMTGAHKSLPLPTYARVTRLDTGKSVIVRINDRGPFHSGRVIDLSYAAAARLGMLSAGSAQVEVVALDPMETEARVVAEAGKTGPARINAEMEAVPSPQERRSWLQVGVYSDPINAVMMREDLKRKGRADAQIVVGEVNGLAIHRVVFGPFSDVTAMQTAQAALEALGYTTTPMR
ncbi:MAG: septal ring lytic transglycosylase RlpA family protein [Pseudomonadota bacterium]|nr:septal ring lytic transglycosylase RlpA family protein [Pseudomonadota bacterium]